MEVAIEPAAMQSTTFRLTTEDGVALLVRRWEPEVQPPKAVVHITHGMAEHSGRYARVAGELTAAGYAVYAHDQRGHGETAVAPGDCGYFADRDGWTKLTDDLQRIRDRITADHPNVPLFMFGHSMGSLVLRTYLIRRAGGLAGVVISGTSGGAAWLSAIGELLARGLRALHGARGHSQLLTFLTFGDFNRRFKPNRTDFDWLSRDPSEVDKYVADRMCGFPLTVQGWVDVYSGVLLIEADDAVAHMPKDLPIYVYSGEQDPVGGQVKGVRNYIERLQRAGMSDVTFKFYPGGRHEMLNEENRADVQRDLVTWLDAALARRASRAA
jgi:alpha-beta hydrolase superfamily lysophospholipase